MPVRPPAIPRVAERFELYACGVELANAFGELTDPAEQRRRFEAEMAEKMRVYGERYPIDEDFLARARRDAGGERHRARLRPPGHARDRRRPDRAGAVGAGLPETARHDTLATYHPHAAELVEAGHRSRRNYSAAIERVAARYAVAITPRDGRP